MGWLAENMHLAVWAIALAAIWTAWCLNILVSTLGALPSYRTVEPVVVELAGIRSELEMISRNLERPPESYRPMDM
jgi:hypothetical protein